MLWLCCLLMNKWKNLLEVEANYTLLIQLKTKTVNIEVWLILIQWLSCFENCLAISHNYEINHSPSNKRLQMTLPKRSKKRQAMIDSGAYQPPKRKPMKRTAFKAKAKAWTQFSRFIRLRDSDEYGRAKCITCPAVKHWSEMDAGHYITRAKESTLFDERNVSCQCKGCNRFQGGKFFEHEQAIERKFGKGTVETLKIKAGQRCKRTISDYQFMEATYKLRAETILKNESGKAKP